MDSQCIWSTDRMVQFIGWLNILLISAASAAPASQATNVPASAPGAPSYTRQEDVVYGRSYGAALTFDVLAPKGEKNGAAVIMVVSGGWVSAHELIGSPFFGAYVNPLIRRGYTVFAVCHACQPKFQIPEIVGNINRAVRFIRLHAKEYGIDPDRIGITGGSAGGHLSCMMGVAPQPVNEKSGDPVDCVSSKVQAVACFFPPTDFFNYGKEGENALGRGILTAFKGAFSFQELEPKTNALVPITDEVKIAEIGKQISPVYHVDSSDAPTMIIHGDADKLVPMQQAELLIDKLKAVGVPAELVVKPGAGHGWPNIAPDMEQMADWFDKYLAKPTAKPVTQP